MARDKEQQKEYMRQWHLKHPTATHDHYVKNKERYIHNNRERNKKNPEKYLWQRAKDRAKLHEWEFTIEVQDIYIPESCPYLGVTLEEVTTNTSYCPSIDRIDTNKGYIKGNIEVISRLANRMKNNASVEELLLFAKGVFKRHADKY